MPFFNHYIVADPACREGEVRLSNNQSSDGMVMGQVELCSLTAGFRTKVCDTNWDDRDAEVVCRELGLSSGKGAKSGAHFCAVVQSWPHSHLLQQMLQQQAEICLVKEE